MTTDSDGRNTTDCSISATVSTVDKYKESSIKSVKSIESIAEALGRAES